MSHLLNLSALTKVGLTLALALACCAPASAQWIKKPQDLDPFNRNGGVNKSLTDLDRQRLDAIQGAPYVVTLRNPNNNGIQFKINGMPYLVLGHQQITIRGRGTPAVTFDYGLGDGSYRSYNLNSGQTYVFRWNHEQVPERGSMDLLNLYTN